MNGRYGTIFLSLLLAMLTGPNAAHAKQQNLLSIGKIRLLEDMSVGAPVSREPRLRDGDTRTTVELELKKSVPVELVYGFGGNTVSPSRLRIKTSGMKGNQARIEVLVSTLSASDGFQSLRVEPLGKSSGWQSISFEQSAAKWVMIKVSSFAGNTRASIAELQLLGHDGPPVTVYKFNESPANALTVLSKLADTVDVAITDDEASLFKDASDGTFDQWSYAEASLLSSGVLEKAKRRQYMADIDRLASAAKKAVGSKPNVFDRGEALLHWLHASTYTGGYKSTQTDVSEVLDRQTYNCVSSATLYNILARRMGLDARGIEVPDHAFSILYDGTRHADIETTTKHGFNPARNRAGLSDFERKTGFVYIRDKHRSKRRELGDTGMVALTYYNHGVTHSKKKQYHKALLNYFKALSLDPQNKSAVKNVLASLVNWGVELARQGKIDKALSVVDAGLELAPNDRTLRHNSKAFWQQKARKMARLGDSRGAVAALKTAYKKTQDKTFLKMQAWVFTGEGDNKIKQGDWEGALKLVSGQLPELNEQARKAIRKWHSGLYLRWSNSALKAGNFPKAVDVLASGLKAFKDDKRMSGNLGYIAVKWSQHVAEREGIEAGRKRVMSLSRRFPQLKSILSAERQFTDREAKSARERGDFEGALAIYRVARKARPDDKHLLQNERYTWDQWAKHAMKIGDWEHALEIYEKASTNDPKATTFRRNIVYVVQEWGRAVAKEQGAVAAARLITSIAPRFANIKKIQSVGQNVIARAINQSLKAGAYEDAQQVLSDVEPFFSRPGTYEKLVVSVYYSWAKPLAKKGRWEEAVAVYTRGYEKHPRNKKLVHNLTATWHQWADSFMKQKQWQRAITVYRNGLEALPGTRIFQQNIRYCEAQLKK